MAAILAAVMVVASTGLALVHGMQGEGWEPLMYVLGLAGVNLAILSLRELL